jgi:hypothetical protein
VDDEAQQSERDWAAEKRQFVADRREEVADRRESAADARDVVADERDQRADARERELDERELHLDERADDDGRAPLRSVEEAAAVADERERGAKARAEAAGLRREESVERASAAKQREQATERRQADTRPAGLALAFAEIARHLYQSPDLEGALTAIARAAVATIVGCDMASISAPDATRFRTVASTHRAATDVDEAQYAAGEGPCLQATEEPVVYAPEFPDPRWPALGSHPIRFGVNSVASFRVASLEHEDRAPFVGSLNAYSHDHDGIEPEAQEIGLILAAHASTGVSAVRDRQSFERQAEQLQKALETRDVIGQATGILIERMRVTPEEAFDILRRASQNLNMKLRLVAESLTETGELRSGND